MYFSVSTDSLMLYFASTISTADIICRYPTSPQLRSSIAFEGETALGKVTGVEILSHSETPGLGANAANESFTKEYKQDITASGFSVVKDGTGGSDGKIDAITGATITSNAVTNAVNEAVNIYRSLVEGGEL